MLQRSPRRARLLAVSAALLLVLAACGDDDDDDDTAGTAADTEIATDETSADTAVDAPDDTSDDDGDEVADTDDYVNAVVESIGGDEEGASCIATALIDAVGAERLVESGVTPEEFATTGSLEELGLGIDQAAAPQLQSDLVACPSLIELFADASDASDQQVECVRENVSDAQIAELLVIQFVGGTPSQELVDAQTATQACSEE